MPTDSSRLAFEKCKGGNFRELVSLLRKYTKAERKNIVSKKHSDGCTSLIISCKQGTYECVKYLVSDCDADVHQTGSIMFDGELVEGVPPLWCAAAAGRADIVKFLLHQSNADVNQTTLTNSTALRAACFDGHMDVVKILIEKNADVNIANRHGHTCLMISCFKGYDNIVEYLLQHGAKVDCTSLKGNTALHDCAESGNLQCMKLLMKAGAVHKPDEYGQTPIMSAGNAGFEEVVEFLSGLKTTWMTREEKACAYELLGAYYYDRALNVDKAAGAWRKALEFRNKPRIPKKLPPETKAAYEHEREFETLSELRQVMAEPHRARMQTLLIRERILGPTHPDTSYHIRYRGAIFADSGQVDRCIQLWLYALNMQLQYLEPLSLVTQTCFLSFAELFAFVLASPESTFPFIDYRLVYFVLSKCIDNLYRSMDYSYPSWHRRRPWAYSHSDKEATNFMRQVVLCLHFIGIVLNFFWDKSSFGPGLSEAEQLEFRTLVYRFVSSQARVHRSYTILHMACLKQSSKMGRYPVVRFPNLAVIRLLLECGADPNDTDVDHCTPIHVVAGARTRELSSADRGEILRILTRHGAHLDQWSKRKRNIFSLLPKEFPLEKYVNPLQVTNLKCLAARVIRRNNIPYAAAGTIPADLVQFVDLH